MTELSITIMTCPPRRALADALQRQLPSATLVEDLERKGPRVCAARAWMPEEGATHHLVVQDDAVLCAGFLDRVAEVISAAPAAFISLFSASPYARAQGAPYFYRPSVFFGSVATLAPAAMAEELAGFLTNVDDQHDDVAVARFLEQRRLHAKVVVPNLVDHLQVPSLMGHRPIRSSSFVHHAAPFALEVPRG